ncbi:MAG: tetratricopeptide repeat protein [Gammaproteobacteria bacterium]|nr:tetratricopeptide repeat protein [Gammaproteobacteria bacterium]
MRNHLIILLAVITALPALAQRPTDERGETGAAKTVIGQRNPALSDGAQALLAGDIEEGLRLTHLGLKAAFGKREEEAALSNLCAGYIMAEKYDDALVYCEMLITRNDKSWRAYNNRAVIYIKTKQWDKADADLKKGESLNPGAHTMKVARAMYMDAVHPVAPEIEIDDRKSKTNEPPQLL